MASKPKSGETPFDEPAIPPQQPQPKRRGAILDDEMKVMNAINRAIAKLPTEPAKIRVLRYMIAKMEFPLVDQTKE